VLCRFRIVCESEHFGTDIDPFGFVLLFPGNLEGFPEAFGEGSLLYKLMIPLFGNLEGSPEAPLNIFSQFL